MVVLGGQGVSFERGTPVDTPGTQNLGLGPSGHLTKVGQVDCHPLDVPTVNNTVGTLRDPTASWGVPTVLVRLPLT